MQNVVNLMSQGSTIEEILSIPEIVTKLSIQRDNRYKLREIVQNNTQIVDRLAICYLQDSGYSSNGYLVTATFGDKVDACCIIHGYSDGELNNQDRPPLSASFYANSFITNGQGKYDLSRLATRFDPNGGGHINACGCRIQPPGLENNLATWLDMWHQAIPYYGQVKSPQIYKNPRKAWINTNAMIKSVARPCFSFSVA